MARTAKAVATTSDLIKDQEVVATTENVEKNQKTETADEPKVKEFKADATVKIKCSGLAGKRVIGLDIENPISFDKEGIAEVSGIEANRLLTIPGYELCK